jgi:hypothetical protein
LPEPNCCNNNPIDPTQFNRTIQFKLHRAGNYPDTSILYLDFYSSFNLDTTLPGDKRTIYQSFLPPSDTTIKIDFQVSAYSQRTYCIWKVNSYNLDSLSGGRTPNQYPVSSDTTSSYTFEINY